LVDEDVSLAWISRGRLGVGVNAHAGALVGNPLFKCPLARRIVVVGRSLKDATAALRRLWILAWSELDKDLNNARCGVFLAASVASGRR